MANDQRVALIKDYQAKQTAYSESIYRLRQRQLSRPVLTQQDCDRYDAIQLKIDRLLDLSTNCDQHINSLVRQL